MKLLYIEFLERKNASFCQNECQTGLMFHQILMVVIVKHTCHIPLIWYGNPRCSDLSPCDEGANY